MLRRDKNALLWFNKKDGTKVRWSIGPYKKARVPELADISITDYCTFGCDFCYRGSDKFGKHAKLDDVFFILRELQKHKVPEIAIGGGDPTFHPHFKEILLLSWVRGIIPNFTTRNVKYIINNWSWMNDIIGAFAYSAETANDIVKFHGETAHLNITDRVNLHCVMGLLDEWQFAEYLITAWAYGYRVTLLGYKTTGRGNEVEPIDYSWWTNVVNRCINAEMCPILSIDTPLAAEYDGRMPVDKSVYHTKEGAVSVFIDAVSMKMGASSFSHTEELVPFDANWISTYKKIKPV